MEEGRTRFAQEITSSIREVKVYEMESQLLSSIEAINLKYALVMTRINFLQQFPRIYFETAGLCVLLALCGVFLYRGDTSAEIFTFLMLSGFAAFRALPSVAKILAQFQTLRFYRSTLTNFLIMLTELGEVLETKESMLSSRRTSRSKDPAILPAFRIIAKNASYAYSSGLPNIFQDLSFEFCSGQIIGLVGQSGSGKSTLLDCIIGLRNLKSGSISVLNEKGLEPTKVQLAYVPQNPVVFEATVWRNLTLELKDPFHDPVVDFSLQNALSISGFDEVMRARELGMLSFIIEGGRNLSGGQRQRLALARALARQGDLLVLDEATSALDMESEEKIYDEIRRVASNRIVIIVTHRPHLLKYCDQVIEMFPGGKVSVNGRPTEGKVLS